LQKDTLSHGLPLLVLLLEYLSSYVLSVYFTFFSVVIVVVVIAAVVIIIR
jgi:hypothetical protein